MLDAKNPDISTHDHYAKGSRPGAHQACAGGREAIDEDFQA